jgi:hypothetical protein
MLRRSLVIVLLLGVALAMSTTLGVAKTALTTSNVPSDAQAGEPFKVTFGTENHDGVALDDAAFQIVATPSDGGEPLVFSTTRTGDMWEADVTLPTSGAWTLRVEDDALGFAQELPSIAVAANPLAPVTTRQLDDALAASQAQIARQVTGELSTQLAGVSAQQNDIAQQLATLRTERDSLAQRVANLEASAATPAPATGTPWWVGALLALALAALLALSGYVVLLRRGALGRLTLAPRHA